MAVPKFVESVLGWLRGGYPEGVPPQDMFPLLALLQRSLTPQELDTVVTRLAERHPEPVTHDALCQVVAQVKDAPPTGDDVRAVAARLARVGWPLALPHGAGTTASPTAAAPDAGGAATSDAQRPSWACRMLEWLRAGYPEGIPPTDYIPMLALLRRRLTDEEVERIVTALIAQRKNIPGSDHVVREEDARAAITQVVPDAAEDAEIDRIRGLLAEHGWPLESSPGCS